jgi:UvrD-like helicase C-terminal domain
LLTHSFDNFGAQKSLQVTRLRRLTIKLPWARAISDQRVARAAFCLSLSTASTRSGLDPVRQATAVCTRVLALYEEGVALWEQSVLMRAGRHSNELELELSRRKIPFVKYGGIGYLEAAHVEDFVCVLRIVDNPGDQLSWFRVSAI